MPDKNEGNSGDPNATRLREADSRDPQSAEPVKQVPPPESKKEWEERHDFYLDDAKARISRAKTALLLWIAALLTTWLSGIEQSRHDVEEFVTTMSVQDRSSTKASEKERRLRALTPKDETEAGENASLTSREVQTRPEKDQIDLQKKATQAVNFELFGAKMPMPPLVAPSVWLALLCCMFLKLLSDRWWIFRSLGRALRIERQHLALPARERITDAPWWLAPIPRGSASNSVSRQDLHEALDWAARPLRRFVLPGAGLAVLAAMITAVFYSDVQLLKYAPDLERFTGRTFRVWQIQLATWAPLLLVPACVILICKWATPFEIPDLFSGEPTPKRKFLRDLSFLGMWILAGSGTFWCLTRKTALVQAAPRKTQRLGRDCARLMAKLDRIRKRRLTQIPGVEPICAYKNPRSHVVHVSNLVGAFRFPKAPREHRKVEEATITAALSQTIKTTHIVLPAASWAFEIKAIEAVERKKPSLACDLLLSAVRHDLLFLKSRPRRPSYRLYDLLAGLSVRFNTPHRAELEKLIEKFPGLKDAFANRLKRWNTEGSPWRRRWTAAERVWEISIARPKKSKTELKDFRADSEKIRLRIPM